MGLKEAIALLIFLFFLRGCYDFLKNDEANKCQMTYMFEYPEYVKIPLKPVIAKMYSKYNLYVYGEGKYADMLSRGQLSGIPVLFIPGNAGSFKQARSIGSVLLRMAESSNSKFHFDVFTVDFNEELSGLYGGVLNAQTDYVVECVRHILSLYKQKGIPRNKVILYGHSMGGLITRGVFTHSGFNHQSVNTIFNLATPNLGPVITCDKFIHEYYNKVNAYWKSNHSASGGGIDHVTFISISGGDRDILVRSDLAMVNRLFTDENSDYHPAAVIASSVPESWASTDHLCIIWCKQLVLATARLLFDINAKALSFEKKNEVINYHMVKKTSNSKHYPHYSYLRTSFEFLPNGFWRERNDKTWIFFRKMVVKHSHILVPLLKEGEMIIVTGFNIPKDDWIFACKATLAVDGRTKICSEGDNLSSKTEMLIPHEGMTRRRVQLSVSELKTSAYTHVMVYSSLTNNKVEVIGERYSVNRRHINFQITGGWDFVFAPQTILYSTAPKATFYNISLSGLRSLWQAYVIKVDSQGCQNTCKEDGRGLVQFFVPWARDLKQVILSCNESTELLVKLLVPQYHRHDDDLAPLLFLHLDPDCTYKVSIQVSFNEIMSQIARFYGTMLPSYIVANILLGFSAQLLKLAGPGPCPDFLSSLASCSPLNLVAIPSLLCLFLQPSGLLYMFFSAPIPYVDDVYLNDMALSFVALRPLIFIISYGAVFSSTWLLGLLVVLWSNCFRWIKSSNMMLIYIKDPLTRIRNKWDVSVPTEKQLYRITTFPLITSCIVIAISYVTCGSFGLTLTSVFLFLMLCNMCCDNRALASRKGEHRFSTRWRLYLTIFQLWLWMCLLNVPSLIHWFNNLDEHMKLVPDPALTTAVIAGTSLIAIFQYGVPTDHASSYFISALTAYLASILTTMYSLVNMFRIPYIISAVLFVFCLQQIATIILKKKTLVLKED